MTNNKIIRTKMADALIGAVHQRINNGYNTGRLGRLVLTNEAAGVGVNYRANQHKTPIRRAA